MLIDVSNHQGAINWAQTAPAVDGAYIKVTEGTGFVDAQWRANHDGATSHGRPVGAYHFADLNDPVAEANHFADQYLQAAWQLRPVLDIETSGASASWVRAFRAQFRARTGSAPFRVYTSLSFLTGALNPIWWIDADTDIWAAAYRAVLGWWHPQLVLWQSTSTAAVPGVLGSVDADYYQNGWTPAADLPPAPVVAGHTREELQMLLPPGENMHMPIPASGLPPYLYIACSYGDTVDVHAIDYIGETKQDGSADFKPGNFNDGSLDAAGFHGPNEKTWTFNSDKPGGRYATKIPDGTINVSLRYSTTSKSAVAWVG